MKKAFFTLAILLQCLAFGLPSFAAAKFDATPPIKGRATSFEKHQNRRFCKQVWQSVFQKRETLKKPAAGGGWLNFGGKALISGLVAAIAIFIHGFAVVAILAWVGCIALGVIGLFKDERKAAAIIALGLALVLPIGVLIAFAIACAKYCD